MHTLLPTHEGRQLSNALTEKLKTLGRDLSGGHQSHTKGCNEVFHVNFKHAHKTITI